MRHKVQSLKNELNDESGTGHRDVHGGEQERARTP